MGKFLAARNRRCSDTKSQFNLRRAAYNAILPKDADHVKCT